MLVSRDEHADAAGGFVTRLCRRWLPVTDDYHGQQFLACSRSPVQSPAGGSVAATARMLPPLALSLILVEATDLVFAIDSIPAILAITGDPFLVFTSNVFAMLGLRSLSFALAGMVLRFCSLKVALAGVLLVVGGKMLAAEWLEEAFGRGGNLAILGVILSVVAIGIAGSLLAERRERLGGRNRRRSDGLRLAT